MRFHRESRQEAYDAIVVGAGVGGLAAGALLAHGGRKVLVVERHDRPGGYAHAFRRRRYRFDSAVHLVGGCAPASFDGGGLVHRVLRALGVDGLCDFERVDPFYTAVYPDLTLRVPSGLEEFVEAHVRRFPREEKGIRQVMQLCLDLRLETQRAPELLFELDFGRMRRIFPTLLRYHRTTLASVLDEHLQDPRLKAVLATLWPYLGLPPSRVSFVYWATMLSSYALDGAFYCKGTFQKLADALVSGLERAGGELLLKSTVRRIEVRDGRARGVVLENGQHIAAPLVISNVDARQTFEELVGVEHLPGAFVRELRRMRPSISAFVVYTATRLDLRALGASHETFFYRGFDHERHYTGLGGEIEWLSVTVPTLYDPSLAPAGEHVLTVTTLMPYDASTSWRRDKERLAERLLREVDVHLPGYRDALVFAEAATPRTMERYTRNRDGAIYGFELSPDQVGPTRLANQSPLPGLVLAGHWTRPGGGIYGVVTSGFQTARMVEGFPSAAAYWEALERRPAAGA